MSFSTNEDGPALPEMAAEDVNAELSAGAAVAAHLIDVREEEEFREVRARPAQHLALSAIERGSVPAVDKQATIYLICLSGRRSSAAAKILRAKGFAGVVNVRGGTKAWLEAALPADRG